MYLRHIETNKKAAQNLNEVMKEMAAARLKANAKHRHLRPAQKPANPNRKAHAKLQSRLEDWSRMANDRRWGEPGYNQSCYHRPGSYQ